MNRIKKRICINLTEAEGCTVSDNVYSKYGVLLIGKDVVLTPTLIISLIKHEVNKVFVYK